jgi:hypothetical protein
MKLGLGEVYQTHHHSAVDGRVLNTLALPFLVHFFLFFVHAINKLVSVPDNNLNYCLAFCLETI